MVASAGETDRDFAATQFTKNCVAYNIAESVGPVSICAPMRFANQRNKRMRFANAPKRFANQRTNALCKCSNALCESARA